MIIAHQSLPLIVVLHFVDESLASLSTSVFSTTLLNHVYCCETCGVSGGNFIVDVVMTVMK